MAYEIYIRQEYPQIKVSELALKRIARKILKDLGFKNAILSLLLVGGPQMRVLNKRYLRHAWSTDVLAFSQLKPSPHMKETLSSKILHRKGIDFLGDIVLCLSTIRMQAKEYGHTFEEELHYCLCHGILHLMGYEDKTQKASKKMHRTQHKILQRVQKKNT
ncbi:MAG TPA: rRNA maturation RNase YbeY [Candidatus Omnitrophota bacterium]|nr:rRNA maturation RNase YbeY [Candidatus Omnitrophota bacterium]